MDDHEAPQRRSSPPRATWTVIAGIGKHFRQQPSPRITWALALIGPAIAAAGASLYWDAADTCMQSGQTVMGGPPGVGWMLLLVAPVTTGWYAARGRRWALRAIPAVVVSLAAAIVFGFAAWQVWWVGHGCYT